MFNVRFTRTSLSPTAGMEALSLYLKSSKPLLPEIYHCFIVFAMLGLCVKVRGDKSDGVGETWCYVLPLIPTPSATNPNLCSLRPRGGTYTSVSQSSELHRLNVDDVINEEDMSRVLLGSENFVLCIDCTDDKPCLRHAKC